MNKKVYLFLLLGFLIIGMFYFGKGYLPVQEKVLKKVRVGIQISPAMALVMVAKDKGFFEKEGLDVDLREFTAGKFALEAFLGGSLDFAVSGDVPALLASMNKSKFVVPAQVVKSTRNEVRVVARKDGDYNAKEYFEESKRKLATSFGGGPEFFTYEFLNKLGVKSKNIDILSQAPKDMPAALVNGSVDAIAIFDPFAYIAEKRLGDKAVIFRDESVYSELYVIEAREDVRQNSDELDRLLRGLFEAEGYIEKNPDQAKEVVVKYTKLDPKTVDGIWDSFDFRLALTPQLIEYWNREADWARSTGKVKSDAVKPDFGQIIFAEPLKRIAPKAVEF